MLGHFDGANLEPDPRAFYGMYEELLRVYSLTKSNLRTLEEADDSDEPVFMINIPEDELLFKCVFREDGKPTRLWVLFALWYSKPIKIAANESTLTLPLKEFQKYLRRAINRLCNAIAEESYLAKMRLPWGKGSRIPKTVKELERIFQFMRDNKTNPKGFDYSHDDDVLPYQEEP